MQSLLNTLLSDPTVVSSPQTIARNDFLIKAGEIEQNLYVVEEGAFRVFYLTEFEEHTIRFGYTGSVFNSIVSYFRQEPSELYIQAIRKSRIRVIHRSEWEGFIAKHPELQPQYTAMLEQVIIQQLEREIDLLTHSPVERYQRVLVRSPQLFQEVPMKYIAAYLRMTPETLSRIRKS